MENQKPYRDNIGAVRPALSAPAAKSFFAPINLIKIVLRGWFWALLLAVLGGVGGYFYAQQIVRIYEAEAELEMSVRRPKVIDNEAVFDDSSAQNEDVIFNTRFKKFKSPAMERLATQEYFKRYPADEKSKGGFIEAATLAALIRDVNWDKDGAANIVYVSYISEDPKFAAKLVNILSHCAGELMLQENKAMSDEAVKWLTMQLDDQREELEEVELKLAVLRDELKLDSLEQRKAAVAQSLVQVSGDRETLFGILSSRKTVLNFVKELDGTDPNLEILPAGLPKEAQLNALIAEWRQALEEVQLAGNRFTKIHPEYKAAADKEARAKKRLEQFIEVSAKAVQNEIDLHEQDLQQIDERLLKLKQEAIDLEQQLVSGNQRIQRLERRRDAADNAYQSMLRRMEEARLSADENMAFTKIIREAEVPRISISSGKGQALVMGVVLGGAIGCALVILFALMLDKIESVTDLKDMGLRILGTIPSYRKNESRGELATLCLQDKFCQMIEIFSGINALISSGKYVDKTRVLLMNSAMPGEGKTISACNLAISSAMNGTRTLLIDGDLRRPQLARIFNISEGHPSLLEWLADGKSRLSRQELVSTDVIDNLDIITSRPIQEINPAELLGRGRLTELLKWARQHYDRVIIDSPPIGSVGDAQVWANLSDAIIIVSRIGKTRRRALRFSLAKFGEIDVSIFGCIANDVPHSLAGMFKGAEGYGYSTGYGKYKPYKND
jgi:capsular exopolysaccharide synthesis family protein